MAYELAFALTGESKGVESALRRATAAEAELAESADRLTSSHLRWNEQVQRFISTQGQFVSELEVGRALREELNALGIRTNQQIQEEIRRLEVLERAYQDQDQVVAQLRMRKEMLTQGTQAAAQGMSRGAQAAQQFGFIMNDAQQFTFGFAEGVRAISNNLPGFLMPLIGGGPWAMGLITALNVGATALTLWTSRTKEAGDAAEEAGVKIGGMADQVFRLVDVGRTQRLDVSEAIRLRDRYEEQAEALEEQIEIQERIRSLQGGQGQATAASLREVQRLREEYGHLSNEELEELRNRHERINELLKTANEQIAQMREQLATELEQRGTLLPEEALTFEGRDFVGQLEEVTVELMSWEELVEASGDQLLIARERTSDLREELDFLLSAEGRRVAEIERQNEKLKQQIELQRELLRRGTLVREEDLQFSVGDERLVEGEGVDFLSPDELLEADIRALDARFEAQSRYYTRLDDLREYNRERHRLMLDKMGMSEREFFTQTVEGLNMLQQVSSVAFGSMASLFRAFAESGEEGNERAFRAYKAFAIAEATAAAILGAQKAWVSMPNPLLGGVAAAAALAQGMARVQQIRNLTLQRGGGGAVGDAEGAPWVSAPMRGDRSERHSASNAPSINAPAAPSSRSSRQVIEHRVVVQGQVRGKDIWLSQQEYERQRRR